MPKNNRDDSINKKDIILELEELRKKNSELEKNEEKQRESEEKYRALFDNAPLSYQSLDADGRFIDTNPQWLKTLGYKRVEVIGKFYKDFLHPDWKPHFEKNFPAFKKRGYVHDVQFKIKHKKGHYLDISFEGCVGYNPDGSFKQTYCVFKDITDQKKAEEAFLKSEKKYKTILQTTNEGFWIVDKKGFLLEVNDAYCQMSGYAKNELISMHISDLEAIETKVNVAARIKKVIEQGYDRFETKHIKKNGEVYNVEVSTNYYPEQDGHFLVFSHDITARKKIEKTLKETREQFKKITEQSPSVYELYDINGLLIEVNKAYEELWQFPEGRSRTVGKFNVLKSKEVVDTGLIVFIKKAYAGQIVKLPPYMFNSSGKTEADGVGRVRWLNTKIYPLKNSDNKVTNIVINHEDISDKIFAENSLRENEAKLSRLVANISDVIVILDKSGIITYKSPNITKHFGWLPEDLIGKHGLVTVHPDDKERIGDELLNVINKSDASIKVEYRYRSKNGTYSDIELIAVNKLDDPIINGVIANYRDITERKQVEEKLRESEFFFKESQRAALIGSYQSEFYPRDVWITSEVCDDIFGIDDTYEKTVKGWTELLHPESADEMISYVTDEVIGRGIPFNKEYKIVRHSDSETRWVHGLGVTIEDKTGRTTGLIGTIQDITEKKDIEIEREKLKNQLQQAQKMEAIGTLAGGIAHDFNNILGVIMGYTELTMDDLTDTKKVIINLQRVMKASERAKEMVQQILAFSRKDEQTMISVNIGEIIKETASFLRSTIPTTIEIKFNIEEDCGQIFGNITQINQVLMNLCTNAAFAMKEKGGVLEISLKEVVLDKESSILAGLQFGVYQQLTVSDTGTGMNQEIIERIFEPYFTTKDVDEGTGMGLAVIYGIIKSHSGDIKVYSEPGKGTVFNVYFPVPDSDNTEKLASTDTDQTAVMGNNEKILFVDDDVSLVELGTQVINRLGYQVHSRSSSIEALEAFKADPDKYDLIITDMTMPNMTGVKLASEIHKIRPDIPVILCTGFSSGINKDNYKVQGISALIMKPVIKRELAEAIRDVLDRKE